MASTKADEPRERGFGLRAERTRRSALLRSTAVACFAAGSLQPVALHAQTINANNGTVRGFGGTVSVAVTGGFATFAGANSYTGSTTISGGFASAAVPNAFSVGSSTVISGGVLDLGGGTQAIGFVSIAGGTLQNGALTGVVTSTGGVINGLRGNAALSVFAGNATTGMTVSPSIAVTTIPPSVPSPAAVASNALAPVVAQSAAGAVSGVGVAAISGPVAATAASTRSNASVATTAGAGVVVSSAAGLQLSNIAGTLPVNVLAGTPSTSAATVTVSATGTVTGLSAATPTETTTPTSSNVGSLASGNGVTVVLGANSFTGPTTVESGTLRLLGSLSSPVTVNGGNLEGIGTIGGSVTVQSGGILSPGVGGAIGASAPYPVGNLGALTVGGPLSLSAGSYYVVSVTPTSNSTTTVGGPASLGGATLVVAASRATFAPTTRYTILTANGGLGGTRFAPTFLSNAIGILRESISYDDNSVFLTVSPIALTAAGTVDYRVVAATGNQFAVASGITAGGIISAGSGLIPTALNRLSLDETRAAFDQLSGEGIAGAQTLAFRASRLFTGAITDQVLLFGDAASIVVPDAKLLAYASSSRTPIVVRDAVVERPLASWRAWATGFGAADTIRGSAALGSVRQDNSLGGGAVGLDYRWANGMLTGIALGGSDGAFSVGGRATTGTTAGGHAAFYTLAEFGPVYAASVDSIAIFGNRTARNLAGFGGLAPETERGSFASTEYRTHAEFGVRVAAWDGTVLTPFFAVEAARLRSDGFTETPSAGIGVFALNVKGQTSASVPMTFGTRWQGTWDLGGGMRLRPGMQVAYVHEFAPVRDQVGALVSLPGAAFLVDGARASRDSAQVKVGAELAVNETVSLSGNFDGEFSGHAQSYAGKGAVRVRW